MGYRARTLAAATSDYRTRRVSPDAANFAKGLLMGGIVVTTLWLLLS